MWTKTKDPDDAFLVPTAVPSRVVPQKPIFPPGGRACFLDMEVVAAGGQTQVWVEAKVASRLSGNDQLQRYADALENERAQHKMLVLLAPARRRHELERRLPHGRDFPVVFASWVDVHRILAAWRPGSASDQRRRWLITEVMTYMTEQGHGSTTKLTGPHLKALEKFEQASGTAWHLFELACRDLAREWKPIDVVPQGGKRWEGWGEQRFRAYQGRATDKACRAYQSFAFTVEVENSTLQFGAGVYFDDDKLTEPLKAATKDYVSDGWKSDLDSGEPWLWRYKSASDLLELADIEAQASALTAFALDTFTMLHTRPPSPKQPRWR